MRNRMYGGVRGRKTKVGEKLLRFPPTRFFLLPPLQVFFPKNLGSYEEKSYRCIRKAALGKLKASFLCARLHFLCRRKAALDKLKTSFLCARLHFLCHQIA